MDPILIDVSTGQVRITIMNRTNDRINDDKVVEYKIDEVRDIAEALLRFAGQRNEELAGRTVYMSLPAPMDGDELTLSNLPPSWSFSISHLERDLGIKLEARNDATMAALAIPIFVKEGRHRRIGRGVPIASRPIVAIIPYSGLGVAGLCPMKVPDIDDDLLVPIESEEGQSTYAAKSREEFERIEKVRMQLADEADARFVDDTAVSAERVLSAKGLLRLYRALGGEADYPTWEDLLDAWRDRRDAKAEQAVRTYCAMLGSFAGDVALAFNVSGAVYLMGPVVKRIHPVLVEYGFRRHFEDKPRRRDFLRNVPTYAFEADYACLNGLNRIALAREGGR